VISVGFDQKSPLFTFLPTFFGAKQKNHGALTMVTHRTLADVRIGKWLSKIYLVYFLMRLPNCVPADFMPSPTRLRKEPT